MSHYFRVGLRKALLTVGGKKQSKTFELLGYSVEDLKKHLESQFKDGMSWSNHGKFGWHIDHILPCASFDLTNPEEQKKCFHYSNLQPLWWNENLAKSKHLSCEIVGGELNGY